MTSEGTAAALRLALAPHACFACGELSEHGLHLDLHVESQACWTELEIPAAFQGWEDVVHGGIVATILDEVMAWSLASTDTWGFTARMSIAYRRPVAVGRRIRAEGRLVSRRRRVLTTTGRLVDLETGHELATADGVYVAAAEDRKRDLQARYGYRDRPGLSEPVAGGDLPGRVDGPPARVDAPPTPSRRSSPITEAAAAIVAERRPEAAALGLRLADLVGEPDAAVRTIRDGFAALADPACREGVIAIAPGIDGVLGVRTPLRAETARRFRQATRGVPPDSLLRLADRLARAPEPELRWFAVGLLRRVLPSDPERAWQVLRRMASEAGEWVTVDTLAGVYAGGILAEPFRWAEIGQLVYSPSRWERRLVGSTIATMPFEDRRAGRTEEVAARGLDLVGSLIGDAEPDVAKSLSWALRSLTLVDAEAVTAFCHSEAERARDDGDGHRAWVVRDTLVKLSATDAAVIREQLGGIRRAPGAPSTSSAAALSRAFVTAGAPATDTSHPKPAGAARRPPPAPAS